VTAVPLEIVDWASTTHTGRVRRNNEDSYLADPPLFVVADGMGGAQAGEVASRLAIEAFQAVPPDPALPATDQLAAMIQCANRAIVDRARSDPAASGMGSTVTAALVHDGKVAFGHVGDSRAYLLRGGTLQQLSTDHSLVGELLRQGRLTPEEAEAHPQRSIITRALGATPEVEVDKADYEVEPGDVFLICSDGLSGLVPDDELQRLLGAEGTLDSALRALVRAANDAGGDDNITAIAFRMGGAGPVATVPEGTVVKRDDDTLTEHDGVPVVASAAKPAVVRPSRVLLAPPAPSKRRSARLVVGLIVLIVLIVAALGASIEGLRWAHFIGVDPASGRVAVFAGVPVELGGGHTLYHISYVSTVDASTLPQATRSKLFNHTLRSNSDAVRIVRTLQAGQP
jgi:serine/threonine protein phosphatase PrpC